MDSLYSLLSFLAILGMLVTFPGTLELLLITIGNLIPFNTKSKPSISHNTIAVLVPAHNEEKDLKRTLDSLKKCSGEFDIIVLADNCSDKTAEIGHKCDIRVIERHDPHRIGKHYALINTFKQLESEPYTAYLIIDADTIVGPNLIKEVRKNLDSGDRAVQVAYVIKDWDQESPKSRLQYLASIAFNVVRPRGRQHLGLSAGLHGNGSAFTKEIVNKISIPTDTVVEDVAFHLSLVKQGIPVVFNDRTRIYALPAKSGKAFEQQRTRWEGGRMRLMFQQAPVLAKEILKGKWSLIEPLLDLLLLPLSYHVLILILLLFIPLHLTQLYAFFALLLVFIHVLMAFIYGKGGWDDFKALLMVPAYLLWKLKFIRQLSTAVTNGISWTRTKRK